MLRKPPHVPAAFPSGPMSRKDTESYAFAFRILREAINTVTREYGAAGRAV